MPPPHDLAAEEIALGTVLWGDRTAHGLRLQPRQLWSPEHQHLWALQLAVEELLGDDVEPAVRRRVAVKIPDCPISGRRLLELLRLGACSLRGRELAEPARWQSPERAAASIREKARQRQLIEGMLRVDAALRDGRQPSAELLRWTARRLEQMAVDGDVSTV